MKKTLIISLLLVISGCSSSVQTEYLGAINEVKKNKVVKEHLKLKFDKKSDFLDKVKIGKTLHYAYNSSITVEEDDLKNGKNSKKLGAATTTLLLTSDTENVDARTEVSRQFVLDNGEKKTEIMKIPQYYHADDGEWYIIEYGTTTEESFNEQMEITSTSTALYKIKTYLLGEALATETTIFADFYIGGSGVIYSSTAAWATRHAEATGGGVENGANGVVGLSTRIRRGFTSFDTSSIGADTITSAVISVYMYSKSVGDNDGDDWINIVESTQNSATSLAVGDFDQCGAVTNPTELSTRIDINDTAINAYWNWDLNATGIGIINGSGFTTFGLREGHDALNHTPTANNNARGYLGDRTGTSEDAKIVITHSGGAVERRASFID